MKIDASKSRIPIWIVWSLSVSGNTVLNAICLEHSRALGYKKALDLEIRADVVRIRTWIEKSEANHLFVYEIHNAPK